MTYFLHIENRSKGPYTIGQLRGMWNSGTITGETLYFETGGSEWLPLSTIADILEVRPTPSVSRPATPAVIRGGRAGKPSKDSVLTRNFGLGNLLVGGAIVFVIGSIFLGYYKQGSQAPSIRPPGPPAATKQEAKSFVGITEEELIRRLGQPIGVETHSSSPDGPFKMLKFDGTKGRETFFVIFADDGLVSSGFYRGVSAPPAKVPTSPRSRP